MRRGRVYSAANRDLILSNLPQIARAVIDGPPPTWGDFLDWADEPSLEVFRPLEGQPLRLKSAFIAAERLVDAFDHKSLVDHEGVRVWRWKSPVNWVNALHIALQALRDAVLLYQGRAKWVSYRDTAIKVPSPWEASLWPSLGWGDLGLGSDVEAVLLRGEIPERVWDWDDPNGWHGFNDKTA